MATAPASKSRTEQDRLNSYWVLAGTRRHIRNLLGRLDHLRVELGGDDDLGAPVIDPIVADLRKLDTRIKKIQ